MHRLASTLSLVLALASSPLLAQEDYAPLRDCRALLKAVQGEVTRTPETLAEDVPGGCRFTNVGMEFYGVLQYRADEVTVLVPDLLANFPTGDIFQSADLSIKGLRIIPIASDSISNYLMAQDRTSINIDLVYDTDPDALTAHLKRFSFDAGPLGRFTLSARFSNFDNTDLELSHIGEEMGVIHELNLALEDDGLLATFLLPMILSTLPYDEDPRPVIDQKKIEISMAIRALPESLMSRVSAESLVRFVTAFPQPYGDWTLQFESGAGLPLSVLDGPDMETVLQMLGSDARITATARYRGE